MNRNCSQRAFTLIELMLVIVIIGILVAMVAPRLAGKSEKARIVAAQGQISSLGASLDMFELDMGRFPTSEEGLQALVTAPAASTQWKGKYIREIPKDPWARPYQYKSPGMNNKEDYDLFSLGPDGVEGADDVTNWKKEK